MKTTPVLVFDAKKEKEGDLFYDEIIELSRKRRKLGPTQGVLATPSLHEAWMKLAREDISQAFLYALPWCSN